jgi:hypothetical protein
MPRWGQGARLDARRAPTGREKRQCTQCHTRLYTASRLAGAGGATSGRLQRSPRRLHRLAARQPHRRPPHSSAGRPEQLHNQPRLRAPAANQFSRLQRSTAAAANARPRRPGDARTTPMQAAPRRHDAAVASGGVAKLGGSAGSRAGTRQLHARYAEQTRNKGREAPGAPGGAPPPAR